MSIRIAALAAGLVLASVAHAEAKIVAVRISDVVRDSVQFKAAETKIKSEFEKRRTDLEAQGKALQEDGKNFQRDGDTLSADQRAKKQKDLQGRAVDFDFAQRKFQEDLQTRDRELTQDMMGKIKDVITLVAKEKGADMVLQDPIYATLSVDITADVLKRLNAVGGK